MGIRSILVYLGATSPRNKAYANAVEELGRNIARRGLNLVFGGSREGTMTVLADTVLANGGTVTGVFTKSLPSKFLYPGLTRTIVARDLNERKDTMLAMADAIVAMPGSFGTWDELFNALENAKIDMINDRTPKPIGIVNIDGFYDGLLAMIRRSMEEGFTSGEYSGLLVSDSTVGGLLEKLLGE